MHACGCIAQIKNSLNRYENIFSILQTGKLTRLSQQNLIDCGKSFGDNGCHGGLMDKAFRFLIKQEGIASYASYPYEEKVS